MIDFKVKGTKLPVIPIGIDCRVSSYSINIPSGTISSPQHWYSFGWREYQLETYILAENSGYDDTNFFMIKESDIIKLAKEQGMIKDEFILTKKWAVKATPETVLEIGEYWDAGCGTKCYTSIRGQDEYKNDYWHSNNLVSDNPLFSASPGANHTNLRLCEGFTEITFKQFKKYVLKQDIMEKEIIGYKLKEDCKQYVKAICRIEGYQGFGESIRNCNPIYLIEGKIDRTKSFDKLKEADVLDLWFDPIYEDKFKVGDWIYCVELGGNDSRHPEQKEFYSVGDVVQILKLGTSPTTNKTVAICTNGIVLHIETCSTYFRLATPEEIENSKYPNITINGYKGEFFNEYVKFGCAEISKEVFIDLFTCREYSNTNKDIESVTIGKGTFNKAQIKEIAEYYNAKISK